MEKWNALKWNIENRLQLYTRDGDKISEEEARRISNEVRYCMEAIQKELGI